MALCITAEYESSCRLNAGGCRGLPTSFYKAQATGLSDRHLYKMAGNAVSVPVIYAIGRKIREISHYRKVVKQWISSK